MHLFQPQIQPYRYSNRLSSISQTPFCCTTEKKKPFSAAGSPISRAEGGSLQRELSAPALRHRQLGKEAMEALSRKICYFSLNCTWGEREVSARVPQREPRWQGWDGRWRPVQAQPGAAAPPPPPRSAAWPGNPPGPHGWAAPRPIQRHNAGLPLPAFISFISQRWQAWKGFWWEMCFELAYFPPHTMEALSCRVLQVQTKAAQAVFSSTVWSIIPPLLPELQAYLTNFLFFYKEGSTTDKILLFDLFQTLKKKTIFRFCKEQHSARALLPLNCGPGSAPRELLWPPSALARTLPPRISELQHIHGNPVERVLYSKLNFAPVSQAHCSEYLFCKWETQPLCCKERKKKKKILPPILELSFGLTGELNLRSTTFMKWLQPRKWISIYPGKEGKRKELEMSSTQEKKALLHQTIFVQQLPGE